MTSLRNRIAINCALLLIGALAAVSFISTIVFRAILFTDRKAMVDETVTHLASYIRTHGIPSSLAQWDSRRTLIQINKQYADGKVVPAIRSIALGAEYVPPDLSLRKNPDIQQYHEFVLHGRHYLRTDILLDYPAKPIGIHVLSDLSDLDSIFTRTQIFVILVTLFAVPFVGMASVVVSRRAIQPIDELTFAMKDVTSAKLHQQLAFDTRTDELGELARTFSAMLNRLQASFERERRFIADASHELKTPLTVINANAQMLRRWAFHNEEIRRESIEVIIDESTNLGIFIEEMLSLARIDSGDAVAQEPIDLNRLCEELIAGLKPRIKEKSIEVSIEILSEIQCFLVWGNAVLLRRIFSNLLDNSLKFTQSGSIKLHLTRRDDMAEVVVSDTGMGIPPEELEHVFERLYRTDNSRTRQVEGFGLGLSIAKAFVQLHRGRIFAQSQPGKGTSVYVQLPIGEFTDLSSNGAL
jgi:signal transduction histidine kinase